MNAGLQRRLATGTNAVFVMAFVIAIVGVLVDMAGQYRMRWDVSADGASTLQPETLAVIDLADAQEELLTITAFSAQRKNAEALYRDRMMRDFLRELEYRTARIHTRFIDFDRDRLTAERLGVDRYGTVVIEGRGDRVDIIDREIFRHRGKGAERELEFYGESVIGAGLRQVLTDRVHTLYFLAGHGEAEIYDRGLGELKELAGLLDAQGWTTKTIDLLRDASGAPRVPEDASAVLLAGARMTLSETEQEALRTYLRGGGSVGFFMDTGLPVPRLLEEVGVRVPQGVVLDAVSIYPHEDRPLLRYGRHPITADLVDANTATVFAHGAPLEVVAMDGLTAAELLLTTRQGWVERGTERPPTFTDGEDVKGPVTAAVALELRRPHGLSRSGVGRVVVVGDAELLTDEILQQGPGNATFLVNSLRWLVRADDRMAPIGRPGHIRQLALTPQQLSMIRLLVMGGLPLIAVLLGVAVRLNRRGR